MKYRVLFNRLAASGNGETNAKKLDEILPGDELEYVNVLDVRDYEQFLSELGESTLIICGGDGTLNRFINNTKDLTLPEKLYYYPAGTGNDFAVDIGYKAGDGIVEIAKYLKNLPTVTVNGTDMLFLNGVGYGIDGYCCEVGDKLRETSDKPVNYAGIAIKGLLFYFKPKQAKVTIDGVEHTFAKVWLAPAMNGRYYGGGMMPTPDQDRLADNRKLSTLIWCGSGKLATLMNFPNIFKGEHLKKKMCQVLTGTCIKVEFNEPCALQVDGETILNVREYTARL